MVNIRHMRIEDASGPYRKVLADVFDMLEGADTGVAGTVGVNVLIHVVLTECDSLEEMDAFIGQLAEALRTGVREQIERSRRQSLN